MSRSLAALSFAILAAGCSDEPRREPPPRRDATTAPVPTSDAGRRPPAPAHADRAAGDDGGPDASPAASTPSSEGATDFHVACRPASVPSWPALAWVGAQPALAYYDGEHTLLARVSEGAALDLARPGVSALVGAAPLAPPGLASNRAGTLLATIEGAGPSPRLVVRRVAADLASAGSPREIASSVDARYGPALIALRDGWLIGWIDGAGEVGRALVRRLAPDGAPQGDAQVLSEPPTGAGGLALATFGERVLAAWIDPHLGFSPVSISWADPPGPFAAPRIVTTTGSVNRAAFVAAAAGPGDAGLVVWGHVGALGQDWLSRMTVTAEGDGPRPQPVSRVDAYVTMRASALRRGDRWALAWDAPTTTGRAPPTVVRLQWLGDDGSPRGEPIDVGPGFGVTAANTGPHLALAFVRGLSVCTAIGQ